MPEPKYDLEKFTVTEEGAKLVAEASDLGILCGEPAPRTVQVDEHDQNSHVYILWFVHRDREGDILAWEYHNVMNPNRVLVIYND